MCVVITFGPFCLMPMMFVPLYLPLATNATIASLFILRPWHCGCPRAPCFWGRPFWLTDSFLTRPLLFLAPWVLHWCHGYQFYWNRAAKKQLQFHLYLFSEKMRASKHSLSIPNALPKTLKYLPRWVTWKRSHSSWVALKPKEYSANALFIGIPRHFYIPASLA